MSLPPLRRQVLVPCDPATAYRLWVDGIGSWWPMASHSCFGEGSTVALVGDRFVETSPSGETAVWGTLTEAEEPARLSFTWHPGQDAAAATHVTVTFTVDDDGGGTFVTLVHTGWEAYADPDAARDSYGTGWDTVLDRLAAAAS